MLVHPYLFLDGRCEEALEFYKSVLGARVTDLRRFKDAPMPSEMMPPGGAEKIIHASFTVGDSILMASDGDCGSSPTFQGFSLSLSVKTEADADRVFAALAEGGRVLMPQGKTFFSPRFGMVADRYGVSWMVIVPE